MARPGCASSAAGSLFPFTNRLHWRRMPDFGSFQTVRELHGDPLTTVYVATREGDTSPGTRLVKHLHPAVDLIGETAAWNEVARFLARVEVQQRVAGDAGAANGHGWLPIIRSGTVEDGAYYACDYVRFSVERIATSTSRMTAGGLLTITRGVLTGLQRLRDVSNRPHGNLIPTNVLLEIPGDLTTATVRLTDPLGDAECTDAGRTERDDLRDVGAMLHLLATGTAWRDAMGSRVGEHEGWNRLGRTGEAWRSLCVRLVERDVADPITTLDEMRSALDTVAAMPTRSRMPRYLGIGAAALVVLGVVGWFALRTTLFPPVEFNPEQWQRVCDAARWSWAIDDGQIAGYRDQMDDANAQALRQFIIEVRGDADPSQFNPRTLADAGSIDVQTLRDNPPERAQNNARAVRDAALALDRIEGELRAWIEETLVRPADTLHDRGWTQAAADLKERAAILLADLDGPNAPTDAPDRDMNFLRSIDRAMTLHRQATTVARLETDIEQAVGRIDRNAGGDPMLASFVSFADAHLAGDMGLADLSRQMQALRNVAAALASAVDAHWVDAVDRGYFMAESPAYRTLQEAEDTQLQHFADLAKDIADPTYERLDPADDPRNAIAADEAIAALTSQLARLEGGEFDEPAPPDAQSRVDETIERIHALTDRDHDAYLSWNRGNEPAIAQDTRAAQQMIDSLNNDLADAIQDRLVDMRAYRAELADRTLSLQSPGLRDAWIDQRDALLNSTDDDEPIKREAERLIAYLRMLDTALPSGAVVLADAPAAVRDVAETRRETAMRSLADNTDWQQVQSRDAIDPQADDLPPDVDNARAELAEWLDSAAALLADAERITTRLDDAYGLDETPTVALPDDDPDHAQSPQRDPASAAMSIRALRERWSGSDVAADLSMVLDPIDERLDAVAAVADLPAADLADRAADRTAPAAVRLAAWRRVGNGAGRAEWLAWERQTLQPLDEMVGGLSDERTSQVRDELRAGRRSRWLTHVEATENRTDLAAALGEAHPFGIDTNDATLPAPVQFNLRLHELAQFAAGDDGGGGDGAAVSESAVQQRIEAHRAWLSSHADAIAAAAGATHVETLNDAMAAILASADESVDLTVHGPGVLGWDHARSDDDLIVTYTTASRRVDGGARELNFRRVETTDAATFVSTEEVSLGLVLDIAQSRGLAASLADAMRPRPNEPEMRDGPRIWEATRRGPDYVTDTWWAITSPADEQANEMPASLEPGQPSYAHPMQDIAPHAAMTLAHAAGCRLPTSDEWRHAVRATYDVEPTNGLVQRVIERAQQGGENGNATPMPHLRGNAWASYIAHQATLRATSTNPPLWPDDTTIIFRHGMDAVVGDNVGEASTTYDITGQTTPWFVTVRPDAARAPDAFVHLLGNVAELVLDDTDRWPARSGADGDTVDFDAMRTIARAASSAGTLGVIGGSALSPPEIPVHTMQPMMPAALRDRGYADVGFRLAFPAGPPTMLAQLQRLLRDPPYIIAAGDGG